MTYSLIVPLPSFIQSKLNSLCYGLPHVRWVEEGNFHITLRDFGSVNGILLTDIRDHLKDFFFKGFSITLKGAGHFHKKGGRGIIWIGVLENPHLPIIKKEIDRCLRGIQLRHQDHHSHPLIILGYYERLNPERLGDFLMGLAEFQSLPIEIHQCQLIETASSPKGAIYHPIEEYAASPSTLGED